MRLASIVHVLHMWWRVSAFCIVTLVFLSIFLLFLSLSSLLFGFVVLCSNEEIVHSKCGGETTCLGAISMKFFLCVHFCKKCAILVSSHILCLNMSLCISISTGPTLAP